MTQMFEEEYAKEKKKVKLLRNILETLGAIFLLVGISTAVLNVTIGGFTPILWFLLTFWAVLIIICMEITMMRAFLERKKQGRQVVNHETESLDEESKKKQQKKTVCRVWG